MNSESERTHTGSTDSQFVPNFSSIEYSSSPAILKLHSELDLMRDEVSAAQETIKRNTAQLGNLGQHFDALHLHTSRLTAQAEGHHAAIVQIPHISAENASLTQQFSVIHIHFAELLNKIEDLATQVAHQNHEFATIKNYLAGQNAHFETDRNRMPATRTFFQKFKSLFKFLRPV